MVSCNPESIRYESSLLMESLLKPGHMLRAYLSLKFEWKYFYTLHENLRYNKSTLRTQLYQQLPVADILIKLAQHYYMYHSGIFYLPPCRQYCYKLTELQSLLQHVKPGGLLLALILCFYQQAAPGVLLYELMLSSHHIPLSMQCQFIRLPSTCQLPVLLSCVCYIENACCTSVFLFLQYFSLQQHHCDVINVMSFS